LHAFVTQYCSKSGNFAKVTLEVTKKCKRAVFLLIVKIPRVCQNEQQYSLQVLLGEFLGLPYEVEEFDGELIEISKLANNVDAYVLHSLPRLTLDASFFHKAHQFWLEPESMPVLPLDMWLPSAAGIDVNLVGDSVPVLYGKQGLVRNGSNVHVNLDIFGSAFFMLSRYEELVTTERDAHDRFPAWASVAYKANFLERPIVNEYLEILWQCLNRMWPDLVRKPYLKKNVITCDCDHPFDNSIYSLKLAIRKAARLLLVDKKPIAASKAAWSYFAAKLNLRVNDVYKNSVIWIMDVNEAQGNSVVFYFITHKTSDLDGSVDFNSNRMRKLLREISARGHEIGVHPGYETYTNAGNFSLSVHVLKEVMKEECIEQKELGGRQHYLRWDTAKTAALVEQNGLGYDSSLSFADKCGFRCGVCYDFTMYDLCNRKVYNFKQRPLIVMESTIIEPHYEALGYTEKSVQRFEYFKQVCHQFNGSFNLLWHNCHLGQKDREIYQRLIKLD
jgi:hypothetical protein